MDSSTPKKVPLKKINETTYKDTTSDTTTAEKQKKHQQRKKQQINLEKTSEDDNTAPGQIEEVMDS